MASQASVYVYRSPQGSITIAAKGRYVTHVVLGDIRRTDVNDAHGFEERLRDGTLKWAPSDAANRAATQLMEYFVGKRRVFDIDIAPDGSAFQKSVWKAVVRIPYAQTRTPAELAQAIGRPESYRMVGSALRACPIAVIVPTHRILGSNGRPLGVDGDAKLKGACLKLEQTFCDSRRR